jgi:hypothetical protein
MQSSTLSLTEHPYFLPHQMDKSKKMRDALHSLSAQLEQAKDTGKMTQLDILHQQNLAAGRDKFKTLRTIRSGNTKSRITDFEKL